jgi:pilus assembly protein Flp/PilA
MKNIMKRFVGFLRDEEGATATEYAVMLVLIIVVSLATIVILGAKVENGFNQVASSLNAAIANSGGGGS